MLRSKTEKAVLRTCLLVTPQYLRAVREEQRRADLLDGPDQGISASSLLIGALCSSAQARFTDVVHRASLLLSRRNRGKNMKLVLGLISAVAVAAIGSTVVGHVTPNDGQTGKAGHIIVGGYEGWWNATPVSGSAEGLPRETVAVNTRTGEIVDAFNRTMNEAGKVATVADVDYAVVPDPKWPANSVVIIDTASGKVIEDFLVTEEGSPFDEHGQPLGSSGY